MSQRAGIAGGDVYRVHRVDVVPAQRLPAARPNMKAETTAPMAKALTPKTNCKRRNHATS